MGKFDELSYNQRAVMGHLRRGGTLKSMARLTNTTVSCQGSRIRQAKKQTGSTSTYQLIADYAVWLEEQVK